ncbi:hypothetical protein SPAN111604_04580 [Sphingomonas antarctica]|uniref:hypothetical protein n=1 Tax=Sphingomonas antarctica TaxID=2040274 RepID=UPI0039E89DEB
MIALLFALAAASPEVSLDGVARDGVMRHIPDGQAGLYVESFKGDWYYARFAGPCTRLGDSYGLAFDASPNDRLDKFSAVVADGERCPFVSFTRSAEPPGRHRR